MSPWWQTHLIKGNERNHCKVDRTVVTEALKKKCSINHILHRIIVNASGMREWLILSGGVGPRQNTKFETKTELHFTIKWVFISSRVTLVNSPRCNYTFRGTKGGQKEIYSSSLWEIAVVVEKYRHCKSLQILRELCCAEAGKCHVMLIKQ